MSNAKFLQEIKKRKERREAQGNSEPIETGSPISYPRMVERTYQKKLLRIVREMDAAVKKTVLARLPSILRSARQANERFDDYVDDLQVSFDQMRVIYGEKIDGGLIDSAVDSTGTAIDAANASAFASKISAVAGINVFSHTPGIRDAVNIWARQNVTLIKTLGEEHFKDIERIVIDGVERGDSLRTVTKSIVAKTRASKNRAKLIARDQVGKLTANITARRSADLGVKRFRWVTSLDDRVRASHRALNGKIFSYEKGAEVDGQSGVLPGEPINCRCAIIPIISSVGETSAETKKKVATQKEIDKDIKKEEGRQKLINKRRQETLVKAREAQKNR